MKLHQLIFVVLIGFCFYNCYKEDAIVAEEVVNKRVATYDTNSTDKVHKFVSQYYFKYDRFLITDPDTTDYLFNFGSKNEDLELTAPKQTEEHLWKGIEMIKNLLLDFYDQKFIAKHFPYSIIFTDMITDPIVYEEVDYYVGRYFCLFNIQDIEKMSLTEKQHVSTKLQETIWFYIGIYDNLISLPDDFYSYGEEYYEYVNFGSLWTEEQLYEKGFASNKWEMWEATYLPSKEEELGSWIGFLIKTPEDKLQEILKTYQPMRVKYDYFVKALEAVGIDYRKLKYTE